MVRLYDKDKKESVLQLAVMHCDCLFFLAGGVLVVGRGEGGCNLPGPAVNVGGGGRRRVNQVLDSGLYRLSCCPPAAETGGQGPHGGGGVSRLP